MGKNYNLSSEYCKFLYVFLQVCDTVSKKLSEGVTSSSSSSSSNSKGNDGAAVEKRIRKTAEFGLGQTFQENGRNYALQEKNADSVSKFLGKIDYKVHHPHHLFMTHPK